MDNITFKQLRNITEDEAREMLETICYDDKEKPTKQIRLFICPCMQVKKTANTRAFQKV